jgi:hypothetical protein
MLFFANLSRPFSNVMVVSYETKMTENDNKTGYIGPSIIPISVIVAIKRVLCENNCF